MSHIQNAYDQHQLGIYDDGQLEAVLWNMDQSLQSAWRRAVWENAKSSYTVEFRNFVEKRLDGLGDTQPSNDR